MTTELLLSGYALELNNQKGDFPRIEVHLSAIVSKFTADIDAVEMTAFKKKVRAFIERELPKHVKIREAAK